MEKSKPFISIHIGRFKTPSMILDDKMMRATLFEAAEEVIRVIVSLLKVAFEFTGAIERTEIFEYPIPASPLSGGGAKKCVSSFINI